MNMELSKQILTVVVSFGGAAISIMNGLGAIEKIKELTSKNKGE